MDRRLMLAIATILSFVGVLGLYFYSCSLQPIHTRIGDIGQDDVGNVVRTTGHLTDIYSTSNGDIILELADYEEGGTIAVYIPSDVASDIGEPDQLLPGAEVEIIGLVQEYLDELELTVGSGGGVTILKGPDEVNITIEILVRNPQLFEGSEVTVSGQIANIKSSTVYSDGKVLTASEFRLRYSSKDREYSIACLMIGHDISEDFRQGQPVIFTGTFEYHVQEARYRIVSEEMTLQS